MSIINHIVDVIRKGLRKPQPVYVVLRGEAWEGYGEPEYAGTDYAEVEKCRDRFLALPSDDRSYAYLDLFTTLEDGSISEAALVPVFVDEPAWKEQRAVGLTGARV